MNIVLYTNKIEEYLKSSDVIDFDKEEIIKLADELYEQSHNELDFIKRAYEFVRDNISHSADINEDVITCTASEVLKAGHGICFAKSHLLVALLRCKSVPSGLCYQKIIVNDEEQPVYAYHGLNGIYLKEYNKWIRVDARGNKNGVNAQFLIDDEQLAYSIDSQRGEEDDFTVYPEPDAYIVENLKKNKTRTELWNNLPDKLAYKECNNMKKENEPQNKTSYMLLFMYCGMSAGMAIGVALDNIGVGMCLGMSIGMAIGGIIDLKNNSKGNNASIEDGTNKEEEDK